MISFCRHISTLIIFALVGSACLANTSNSSMDVSPDGKWLLVANPDNDSVTVVDTTANKAIVEIPVGDQPEGVTWIGNGPLGVVTLWRDNQLTIFNARTGKVVQKVKVPAEPYGIVSDKKGTRAWVSHEYPGLVSEIDLRERKLLRKFPIGAFTRGIALGPKEKELFVTEWYTGILRKIDLASGKIVDSWKGHSTDNLSRQVVIHPRRPKAYLPHIRSMVKVHQGNGSVFPYLAICDLRQKEGTRRTAIGMDTFNGVYVITNPWEADISPDGKYFYIIYSGTNDMNVCKVIDDDYKEIEGIGGAVRVGNTPRAIRVSPDGKRVYVYNAMDFNVTVHNETMRKLATIPVCKPAKTPEWVLGKILFNTALRPMTGRRWIACSSCHPDGNHDGRTWQNPEGLRNTTHFFGMAHTHPIHWSGDRDEAQDFEYTIRGLLMGGAGLASGAIQRKQGFEKVELQEKLSGRSKELDALAIYCNSFEFPLSPHIPAAGKLSPSAQRGKKTFFRKDVGCAQCHSGPFYTDSRLKKPFNLHDVGTGKDDPSEKMGTKYDTPTLLGVYRSAPYLHHGKAATLKDVLTVFNKDDLHGKTSHLKKNEIEDLVEFLKSLPYEQTPEVTENTVSYRVSPGKKRRK